MKTTEEREVTPQWGGVGNLGVFAIKPIVFDVQSLRDAVNDDKYAPGLVHLVNSQAHIAFSGKTVHDPIRNELEKKHGEPEAKKLKEWYQARYEEAKKMAASLVPTLTFNYVEKTKDWTVNVFAKRGTAQSRKPVLAQYDGVEKGIKANWTTMGSIGQAKVIESLKLDVTVGESVEAALKALEAKYSRPVAVDIDGLFATE